MGQNPCLIYAYMVGSCANVFVQVQALNQSTTYPPPVNDTSQGIESASLCTCSRTPYNLISACSACQGKDIDSWANYNANCGNLDETYNFTAHVPPGTALPVWATQQTNATEFVWDTALLVKGAGEYTSSNSTGFNSSVTSTVNANGPTSTVRRPSSNAQSIDVSAAIGLSSMAIFLAMVVVASFIYMWRKASMARTEKTLGAGSRASTMAHSTIFNLVIFMSIILACTTTWTAVALRAGGVIGISFLQNLLDFLVFTSWWTFLGASFFLLAFLYDRCNREDDGTFTATRLGTPYAHLTWLIFTWILWILGASLFAAAIAQQGPCQLHCTQQRVIPVFAFIELILVSMALVVVLYSYWSARKRSRAPKRLKRASSQSKGKR